jgi:hypothetical protein
MRREWLAAINGIHHPDAVLVLRAIAHKVAGVYEAVPLKSESQPQLRVPRGRVRILPGAATSGLARGAFSKVLWIIVRLACDSGNLSDTKRPWFA